MRFKRQPKHYVLQFEDDSLEGLEVVAKSLSIEDFLKVTKLNVNSENTEDIDQILDIFAKSLVRWNLDDENGKAVPCNLAGVKKQDFDFIISIIMAWVSAIAEVSPNLAQTSNTSESLGQLPMETL